MSPVRKLFIAGVRLFHVFFPVIVLLISACHARQDAGTSVIVLVDLSRSFAPLNKADERALNSIAAAVVELAGREWNPPVKIVWSKIQASSLLSGNLCGPLEFQQKLIKSESEPDRDTLRKDLGRCGEAVLRSSSDLAQQAAFTDISGAIALAAETARNAQGEKVLVILSDFLEHLPPNTGGARLRLHGERVVLAHRPGIDLRGLTVPGYLGRISGWAERLRAAGAKQVVSLPVFGITEHRIVQSLTAGRAPAGTAVSVVVNLPEGTDTAALPTIAAALSRLSANWDPPVTITWSAVENSAVLAHWMPPVEFAPHLNKRPGGVGSREDLAAILNQCARGLQRFRSGDGVPDLSGALALQLAAAHLEARKVLLIVSDFRDLTPASATQPFPLLNTRVAMIATPNTADSRNEQDYFQRLDVWEQSLKAQAESVCRIQLRDLTVNTITVCLSQTQTRRISQ